MTDSSVRVPEISEKHDGREVDCELVTRGADTFYRQRTNAHGYHLDIQSNVYEPNHGFNGAPISMMYRDAVAKGLVTGSRVESSFGERTTTGAETNFPVWPDGAFVLPPSAGVQMSIVSTSANDSSAGTNIRTVEVHYLDANLAEQHETVTLNGITPVLTVATNIRFIQCMHIATYGTNAYAAGTITASNAGKVYSQISVNELRCSSSFRMIPAGKRLFIDTLIGSSISGTSAARTIIKFVASELDAHQYTNPLILIPHASIGMQDNSATLTLAVSISFTAGSVVGFVHTSDKAAIISASWFGRLEDA